MKINQFGRTMMETLGVIAVIGVLGVSGLQLYAKAMNTIKVNHLMQKVYLLANQIRSEKIDRANRKKAFDLPKVAETLSYGFSFDTGLSDYKNKEIEVVIKGDFTAKICKMLKKKLKDEEHGHGLKSINGCDGDSSKITFSFAPDFKTKKKRTAYSSSSYQKAKEKYQEQTGGSNNSQVEPCMKGALICDPLVCDVENGWFEFEDDDGKPTGKCEECPAGYSCE